MVVGKEMLEFGSIFGSLPDFREREKSSRPVFTMCGEHCKLNVDVKYVNVYRAVEISFLSVRQ